MSKFFPAVAALVAAGALVLPTVTRAADINTARISYADLDLASKVGQHSLTNRIEFAADRLCGVGNWKGLALADAANDCSSDAVSSTMPQYEAAVAAARRGSVTVLDGAALIVTAH
jgi:UrcA family protein